MARLNGTALAGLATGIVFLYAGVKGKSVSQSVQYIIQGKNPAGSPRANPITAPAAGAAPTAGFDIAENIPAGKGSYSRAGAAQLWVSNGGPSSTAAFAAAVAMAESGGSATVTSSNPDGGINVGIFQLDTKGVGAGYSAEQLQDANLNTQITIMATNGGTNWSEWGDPVTAAVGYHYTPGSPVP